MDETGGLWHVFCRHLAQHGHHRCDAHARTDEHIGFIGVLQHKITIRMRHFNHITDLYMLMQGIGHIARGKSLARAFAFYRNAQFSARGRL